MYFDADLFVRVTAGLCQPFRSPAVEVRVPGGAVFRSFDDWARQYAGEGPEEWSPPDRILVFEGGTLAGFGETEHWWRCGGPAPYHDSITLSLYTQRDLAGAFRAACEAACRETRARITGVYEGRPRPYPAWRRRLLAFIGRGTG
jgi:hypothetical protein